MTLVTVPGTPAGSISTAHHSYVTVHSPRQCFETGHLWAHVCLVKLGRKHMPTPPRPNLITTTAWRTTLAHR
ncbi:hypothetical protein C0J52_24685 [Blattella germanica]|nr:hypothetical protein C0J52_24685 [Blattella germanica]